MAPRAVRAASGLGRRAGHRRADGQLHRTGRRTAWWGERHGVDVSVEGLAGLPRAPVLTSGFVHVTGLKALGMLGLGRGRLTTCADSVGAMDLAALDHELRALDGAPAIVIGNAGEVNTGLFDPLEGIADLCDEYGAWLHVDGAFGLFARVSPRTAELAAGVERSHSLISDGHKWLNVPFDCGFAFVRDPQLLARTFAAGAAYLPDASDDRPIFAYRAPELSRRRARSRSGRRLPPTAAAATGRSSSAASTTPRGSPPRSRSRKISSCWHPCR